jgi:transposase
VVSDATRICELLVGLPDVTVLGVIDHVGGPIEVRVESRGLDRLCVGCGMAGWVKDRDMIALTDLPCFGRPTMLVWRKTRLACPNSVCAMKSWTIVDDRIAPARMELTTRAGRWVTEQVGRYARTVNDVAAELGCDWHTVNDAVVAYGEVLADDPNRIGETAAVGLDETLFVKRGPFRTKAWATSIVDVAARRLLDIVPGQGGAE